MRIRNAVAVAVISVLTALALWARPAAGSICVVSVPAKPSPYALSPDLFCKREDLSLKIDSRVMAWPIQGSVKLGDLDPIIRHHVVVLCHSMPQQSFGFRFSDFKTRELGLFLNDLYKTVQLWEVNRCPWCRCK